MLVKPRVVAVPYWSDRHPDHVAASHVLTEAVFNAGLRQYAAEGDAWKPDSICYYFINDGAPPSFVDRCERSITRRKRLALAAMRSIQTGGPGAVATRLTSSRFQQLIESRDAQFGAQAGVAC